MECLKCGGPKAKNGFRNGKQQYYCSRCKSIKPNTKKMGGISVKQFRKNYDVVFVLSQVPEKFEEDTLYEKSDIINMSGLSPGFPGLGTVLESEDWKKYQGRAGQKNWFGNPELINKLKEEGIMR